MSGTSMDGLDIALCSFYFNEDKVSFCLSHAKTISYPTSLESQLRQATELKSEDLCLLDKTLGLYFAEQVNAFMKEFHVDRAEIDAIASHGHTIFHQPEKGFTLQIGCGSSIALHTQIPVINDFRTKDVLMGGQGAPLVPIGDFDLFGDHADGFLNLGGFSNISFKKNDAIIAFDICPCNLPLNTFSEKLGFPYDKNGALAESGQVDGDQLQQWNSLAFYEQAAPKSLGTEWLTTQFYTQTKLSLSPLDLLCTGAEHIAIQIAKQIEYHQLRKVLITGGGAKNAYLLARLRKHTTVELILPESNLIEFKEALIFAYLGALFLQGKPNNIPSVTGARNAVCGGVRHEAC